MPYYGAATPEPEAAKPAASRKPATTGDIPPAQAEAFYRENLDYRLATLTGAIAEGERNPTISREGFKLFKLVAGAKQLGVNIDGLTEAEAEAVIRQACTDTGIPREANGIVKSARNGLLEPHLPDKNYRPSTNIGLGIWNPEAEAASPSAASEVQAETPRPSAATISPRLRLQIIKGVTPTHKELWLANPKLHEAILIYDDGILAANKNLKIVRDYAKSQALVAGGVYGAILHCGTVYESYRIRLPAFLGLSKGLQVLVDPTGSCQGGLNVGLVGGTGSGKTRSIEAAYKAYNPLHKISPVTWPSSAAGVIRAFYKPQELRIEPPDSETGFTNAEWRLGYEQYWRELSFMTDEITLKKYRQADSLSDIADIKRKIFTGTLPLSLAGADREKTYHYMEPYGYRAADLTGSQHHLVGLMLGDTEAGDTQRIVIFPCLRQVTNSKLTGLKPFTPTPNPELELPQDPEAMYWIKGWDPVFALEDKYYTDYWASLDHPPAEQLAIQATIPPEYIKKYEGKLYSEHYLPVLKQAANGISNISGEGTFISKEHKRLAELTLEASNLLVQVYTETSKELAVIDAEVKRKTASRNRVHGKLDEVEESSRLLEAVIPKVLDSLDAEFTRTDIVKIFRQSQWWKLYKAINEGSNIGEALDEFLAQAEGTGRIEQLTAEVKKHSRYRKTPEAEAATELDAEASSEEQETTNAS